MCAEQMRRVCLCANLRRNVAGRGLAPRSYNVHKLAFVPVFRVVQGALQSRQTARGPPADEAKFGIHAREPTTLPWFPGKFNSQYSAFIHAAETEGVGQTSVVFGLHTSQEG